MIEAYPLSWPVGYSRTTRRISSRFKQGMEAAQRFLRDELKRMDATSLVISTNIPVRADGGLYADWMKRKIEDPGVAIFFKYKGDDVTMCCDQYERIWENIYALGKSIEAIRAIERYGVSEFLKRSFTGFKALPAPIILMDPPWYQTLGVSKEAPPDEVKKAYHTLSMKNHPDKGGDAGEFHRVQQAYESYKKLLSQE